MKKFYIFMITISIVINTLIGITFAEESTNIEIKVILNNTPLTFDVAPFVESGRTLVPLRAIFEALNATVEWDGYTNTVTATKGEKIIKLQIGNNVALIDGKEKALDIAAKIVNNRTFVPLRFVSESLGAFCEMVWRDKQRFH